MIIKTLTTNDNQHANKPDIKLKYLKDRISLFLTQELFMCKTSGTNRSTSTVMVILESRIDLIF